MKRAEFLIETWFLTVTEDFLQNLNHNADSPDEATELLKLKSELLAAVDGPNKLSFIPPDRNINLLFKAVRAHKDSTVLAAPHVLCLEDKTAKIEVVNNETYYIVGYTEPNSPSEKPQPIVEKAEEGITLSLRPNLTSNKNIDMQFESIISQFLDFEERKFDGKGPYKPPKVRRTTQTSRYIAENGQTLLLGGNKIADRQDNRAVQKELLILIKSQTVGSSEQDKPAKADNLIVTEPPRKTTNVITQPAIAKSRTETRRDNEQEKTKTPTEQHPQMVQKFLKLKYQSPSQTAEIVRPLLTETGYISTDENRGYLLVIDTVENLKRMEKIIAEYDVPNAGQTITEIFEIRYGDPVEIVELLKKLINGRPDAGSIIDEGKEQIVLVPEPSRKWIIAKASAENIKQIGRWIEKLDTSKSRGMGPVEAAVYEKLETIVDLSDLTPGMSFGEVIERLKNSVEPPLQIQPIWKDLLENAEVEQATLAGMDPLTGVKLRQALEILLTSVSSTGLPKLTYVVDEGVILIRTVGMLAPKMVHRVYDISDLVETATDADALRRRITEKIEPDTWFGFGDKGQGTILAYPVLEPQNFAVMQSYDMYRQIENFLDDMRSRREKEIIQRTLDDIIASRKELRKTKEHKQQPSQVQTKITKLLDESEEPMTPLEQIQKQLDELMKQRKATKVTEPNIFVPQVPLISKTFMDAPLRDALKSIAEAANINIITDGTIEGNVSCTLKEVTIETALDIVLGGTTYVWEKTPNFYLVISVELAEIRKRAEITQRTESTRKLSNLGKALLIYAKEHDDKYPVSLHHLPVYLNVKDYRWVLSNVEYLAHGKTLADRPDTVIAYDKTLLKERKGTNVLYNDCHVGFEKVEKLKQLGIGDARILIQTQLWSVTEDFLKAVGLDANSANFSDVWTGHLAGKYSFEPNRQTYFLMIDDLHVNFLTRAIRANPDSKVLAAPEVLCLEGRTAEIAVVTEEYHYVSGYNEPQDPSGRPQPIHDKAETGTHLWLKPILSRDNEKVVLDLLKLENSQLEGIIEGKYKEKYPYQKPIVNKIITQTRIVIPDGKTMLIGGLNSIEQAKKEPPAPLSNKLPLIGKIVPRSAATAEQKMLLILIKPITNPWQKATKILPGREDAEDNIRRLAEQLDKKMNPAEKPKL